MTVVRRPRRSTVTFAVVPGVFAAVALARVPVAVALGLVGLAVVTAGTARGSRRVVTAGGLAQFAGVLVAGIAGVSAGLLLLGAAASVVAWTTGQHAVGLARQLGRDAPVHRSVLAHVASATLTTLSVGTLALGAFRFAEATVPAAAVAFLLVGGVVLLFALRS